MPIARAGMQDNRLYMLQSAKPLPEIVKKPFNPTSCNMWGNAVFLVSDTELSMASPAA
jgi:hypothetical protein